MQVVYEHNRFEAITRYDERHKMRETGFRWDPKVKRWHTTDPVKAKRLYGAASEEARKRIDAAVQTMKTATRLPQRFSPARRQPWR